MELDTVLLTGVDGNALEGTEVVDFGCERAVVGVFLTAVKMGNVLGIVFDGACEVLGDGVAFGVSMTLGILGMVVPFGRGLAFGATGFGLACGVFDKLTGGIGAAGSLSGVSLGVGWPFAFPLVFLCVA